MRLFAQSFHGEVKKCFRGLAARSIHDFQEFEAVFLRQWERKRNSLHLLTQNNNLKRGPIESVQDFSTRFMKTYDSMPMLSLLQVMLSYIMLMPLVVSSPYC